MKKVIFIFIQIIMLTILNCNYSEKKQLNDIKDKLDETGKKINAFYDININECKQKILVQSNNIIDNPILLYLHGGPGSSFLIYSHLCSEKLKEHFIFVNWDQRGTAFSYHDGMDSSKISEDQISDDTIELVKYLLQTFNKKKIYLLGHSFGSVIGLRLVANHPEYFYVYIGVGQVIDYNRSVEITYKWLHEVLEKANDIEGLKKIEKDHFPYIDLIIKYGGRHRLSIDFDALIKTSPYYFKDYPELLIKGKEFSQEHVGKNPNPKAKQSKSIYDISIPLYFFEGINDHVIACAPELVVEYCKNVNAPKKEIIWFQDSAHIINLEEPDKFQDELIKILNENYS